MVWSLSGFGNTITCVKCESARDLAKEQMCSRRSKVGEKSKEEKWRGWKMDGFCTMDSNGGSGSGGGIIGVGIGTE